MTSTVRVFKGLLTKRCHTILDWLHDNATLVTALPDDESAKRQRVYDIRLALKTCDDHVNLLELSMTKLAQAFDDLDEHSEADDEQFDKYMETAQDAIMKLHAHKSKLQHMAHVCATNNITRDDEQRGRITASQVTPLSVNKLPQIPIPIFTGKKWNWDNFWALFQDNVHNQDLTELQKFNYLLSSLKGEARQSISRFHVTPGNYAKAVEHLQKRYGNKEGIVMELNRSLRHCVARGPSTSDQRQLFDKLSAIAAQLKEHGENLNNQLTIQTFLQKFHGRIHRAAVENRLTRNQGNGSEWDLEQWLATIDNMITKEEMLTEMLHTDVEHSLHISRDKGKNILSGSCECCGWKGHRWYNCPKIPNPNARRNFLIESSRCLNCGSPTHRVSMCSGGNCRSCDGKHHTSICTKAILPSKSQEVRSSVIPSAQKEHKTKVLAPRKPLMKTGERLMKRPRSFSRQHVILTDTTEPVSPPEDKDTLESSEKENPPGDDTLVLHMNNGSHDFNGGHKKVILLAGTARVLDFKGAMRDVTVLLDTGSELSFIEERLAQDLGLPVVGRTSLLISTFGSSTPTPKECDLTMIQLCDMEGVRHEICVHKNDFITGTIEQADLDKDDLDFIGQQEIVLSLPMKNHALQPRILLGCDYLWNFMAPMGRMVLPSGLMLIPTKFGYVISGQQNMTTTKKTSVLTIQGSIQEKDIWDSYWSLESSGTEEYTGSQRNELHIINDRVLEHFKSTIQKREDGYYVRLPWKDEHPALPDNKIIALKRLQKVLELYAHKPETLKQYDSIFREQLENGIIEEVSPDDPIQGQIVHYLPHQAVITPLKATTKMRIVFDASAHYKDSPCLNDVLHQGPLLLPDMVGMLLRFRAHNIAVISDVEKAFLQVRLQELDRDATRCFWVRDFNLPAIGENVVIYRFTRVTFGLNTSPFLLAATIDFHLENIGPSNDMAEEIRRNLYVDNLVYGAQTVDEALTKYGQSKEIFEGLNMNLREFISNDDLFNSSIQDRDRSKNVRPKVLGITWNTKTDRIILIGTMVSQEKVTKRAVSQQLASIFDPLGLLVPLLLPAKVFLQSLWRDDYAWDTPLPSHLHNQWRILCGQISTFYKEVGRKTLRHDSSCTLFAFSDASQFAMATCIYLASMETSQLVMAKSKLPSLKSSITIPKLEMNALTLSVRVAFFVCNALDSIWKITHIVFFTDSEIVLGWLKSRPAKKAVGVLIWNRLREVGNIVRDLKERGIHCLFGHISSADNPADCATRGLSSDALQNHFWWNGPEMIKNPAQTRQDDNLFSLPLQGSEGDEESANAIIVASLMTKREMEQDDTTLFKLSRFHSLYKAERVVCYVLKFVSRALRNFSDPRKEAIFRNLPFLRIVDAAHEITGAELRVARRCIIRDHQTIVDDHRIKSQKDLNIRQDEFGVLRCYGRLQHADISTPSKTPIYIAPKTALAKLIILEAHGEYHRGLTHTMSAVREQYWIPKLRQQVRVILKKCLPCQKLNNLPFRYPPMGDLPSTRVRKSRPFEHVGLDYFGPLAVSSNKNESMKAYGCIFTCRTTRLLHLELVENMTTEAFLNVLRRFFARRGVPNSITCDNAPTSLLGEQILADTIKHLMVDTKMKSALARREIDWIHITPYAPWQGGFYERLIRSIKYSLYKALGKRIVSFDVMYTMLVEIEAVLNSRPLTYQEERWEQQPILRPIDFIQNDIILDFPFQDNRTNEELPYYTPDEAQQLKTQHQVEEALQTSVRLTNSFWRIWSAQYLTGLREHHKHQMDNKRGTTMTPREGDVVLLCDSSQPRNIWKIARIVELRGDHPDTVREVVVELPNKTRLRRPVNRVVPLEIGNESGTSSSQDPETPPSSSTPTPHSPYNLRKRKLIRYSEDVDNESNEEEGSPPPRKTQSNLMRNVPFILTILCSLFWNTSASKDSNESHTLRCIEGGVELTQPSGHQYEICSEDYCLSFKSPGLKEVVRFPPQVTLHEHLVKWKIFDGHTVNLLETTCKAAPFCAQIDCTFCVATMANPECWPRTAIFLTGLSVYVFITLCYCLFHVPVIVGSPILYLLSTMGRICFLIARSVLTFLRQLLPTTVPALIGTRRARRRRLWSEIAVFIAILSIRTEECQEVDVYAHQIHSCYRAKDGERCTIDTSEIVKINPFKQEACLRLTNNSTNLLEVQLLWKNLDLICEKETILFSRSTRYGLLDSKRCPHAGSCTGEKCGAVNRTSQIAELRKANIHPGVTGCVESCGEPGCDCFYPSSGCLFYRIYLLANDDAVYEFFRCARWKEVVYLQMTVNGLQNRAKVHNFHVIPNKPQLLPPFTITLSSLSLPPIPLLSSNFLTDGTHTALAPLNYDPPLKCSTWENAKNMTCEVEENCKCAPAEVRMLCDCRDLNLTAHVLNPEYQLPILRPNLEFRTRHKLPIARIRQSPTAEFIVRIKDRFETISIASDAVCTIEDTHCIGCYNCAKGAQAAVLCKSSTPEERAELRCGAQAFTVPCSLQGTESVLSFLSSKARFHATCSVQCGKTQSTFEITGILRYTGSLDMAARRLLNGESEIFSEVNLPDIGHLVDTFMKWSGTLFLTVSAVVVALLSTYFCITNTACLLLVRILFRLIMTAGRLGFWILRLIFSIPLRLLPTQSTTGTRKLEEKTP
ncbi:integrase core domain protein [Ancylostoma ceylanicum]|uniref:Integrase core domain protein n=1 Tax=Ancylostoma ceylanicum TaxID=53326 RepID=A0A0D6L7E8_9BILA|nr:integrase core domain protein [Ancylostoma ceylanicum]